MPGQPGRNMVVKIGSTPIAGVRTKSLTVNGTPISQEDQDDGGLASYLGGELVERSLEITVEGVTKSDALRDAKLSSNAADSFFDDLGLDFPNGDEIVGGFVCTAYGETGEYRDAVTFTATFMSDGDWTFTPNTA